jgi:hypothetical protein
VTRLARAGSFGGPGAMDARGFDRCLAFEPGLLLQAAPFRSRYFGKEKIMRIREFIEDEIALEKKMLEDVEKKCHKHPCKVLIISRRKTGKEKYYYRERSEKKKRYIKMSDKGILQEITYGRFLEEQRAVLSGNIRILEAAKDKIRNYDTETISKNLPKTYQKAREYINGKLSEEGCIQSENGKNPEGLNVICSNGLRVRSKNEMVICEMLLFYGITFRYEMALVLSKIEMRDDGTAFMINKTVYPDFTIFLPDGSVIYWEHFGMLDRENYREDFTGKMLLYYDNDIFPPKNLIITMDGPGKGFDNQGIKRIIEERILPLMQ